MSVFIGNSGVIVTKFCPLKQLQGDAFEELTCLKFMIACDVNCPNIIATFVIPIAPAAGSACPIRDFVALKRSDAVLPECTRL
jgi:hypothetical protein